MRHNDATDIACRGKPKTDAVWHTVLLSFTTMGPSGPLGAPFGAFSPRPELPLSTYDAGGNFVVAGGERSWQVANRSVEAVDEGGQVSVL